MNSIDKIKKSLLQYHQFELISNRNKYMSDNEMSYILRSGKYKGKKWTDVQTYNKGYIDWVRENRPEMLKPLNKKGFTVKPAKEGEKVKFIPLDDNTIVLNDIHTMKNRRRYRQFSSKVNKNNKNI